MSTAVSEKKTTAVATIEERSVTYIPIGEKDELTLTVGHVEKFLCVKTRSGKIANRDDIMKFMMLCKAQGLNPWVNDAYLVGYDGNDGPKFQLISAHQALLKRAELSSEYDGMESGVCVMNGEGEIRERQGDMVVKGETLVGGWARVWRRDRKVPSYDSLNLATYSTGKSRWNADPAGMIVKCAEASAMRKAFPSTLAQMYCREEMERQIEFGDGDRPHRIEHTASDVKPASKSEALIAVLAKRSPAKEPESNGNQHSEESNGEQQHEGDSGNETETEPTVKSSFDACQKILKAAGCEVIDSDPEGTRLKYKLPNNTTLLIGDGASGEMSVDTFDPDAVAQVQNEIDRALKARK